MSTKDQTSLSSPLKKIMLTPAGYFSKTLLSNREDLKK